MTAIEVIASGRNAGARLEIDANGSPTRCASSPRPRDYCVCLFEGQDFRFASAALAAGAHYLDLADGRDFVAGFEEHNDAAARCAGRIALSGASTFPALFSGSSTAWSAAFRSAVHPHRDRPGAACAARQGDPGRGLRLRRAAVRVVDPGLLDRRVGLAGAATRADRRDWNALGRGLRRSGPGAAAGALSALDPSSSARRSSLACSTSPSGRRPRCGALAHRC